jgi:hypothetical protein
LSYLFIAHTIPSIAFVLAAVERTRLPRRLAMPLLWIAVAGLFVYVPLSAVVLTRVLFAVSVPFGLIGCWGLLGLSRRIRSSALRRRLVTYGVLVASMVSLYQLAVATWIPLHGVDGTHSTYVPDDLYRAMPLLERQPPGVVMNLYKTGQFVPPFSGQATYVGNIDQTLDSADRQADAIAFYRLDDVSRSRFMRANNVTYVLAGAAEREVASQAGSPLTQGSTFVVLGEVGDIQLFRLRG